MASIIYKDVKNFFVEEYHIVPNHAIYLQNQRILGKNKVFTGFLM